MEYRVGRLKFDPKCIEDCPKVHRAVGPVVAKLALNPGIDADATVGRPTLESSAEAVLEAFDPESVYKYSNECAGPKAIRIKDTEIWLCNREKLPLDTEL